MNKKYLIVNLTKEQEIKMMNRISIDINTGCWNWSNYIDAGGYGRIMFNNHQESAHRVFYAWKKGKLPRGKSKIIPQLDHLCKNRKCCNPDHLELVSFKENILRGNSPSAQHSKQLICKNGHILPSKPNLLRKNGKTERVCLICQRINNRINMRKWRLAKKLSHIVPSSD